MDGSAAGGMASREMIPPAGLDDDAMTQWFLHQPCPAPWSTLPAFRMPMQRRSFEPAQRAQHPAGRCSAGKDPPMSSALCIAMYGQATARPATAGARLITSSEAPFAQHGTDLTDVQVSSKPSDKDVCVTPHQVTAPFATWSKDALTLETIRKACRSRVVSTAGGVSPVAGYRITPPREFDEPLRKDLNWLRAVEERPVSRRGGAAASPRRAHESQITFGENA